MKPDDSRSLIAFVQKHKQFIRPYGNEWRTCVSFGKRPWGSTIYKLIRGKTWLAAVRKAKRVIEKGNQCQIRSGQRSCQNFAQNGSIV